MKSGSAPVAGGFLVLAVTLGLCASTQTTVVPDPPLWVGAAGRPTADAREAMALLARASEEGLDPADYAAADLQRAATSLEAAPAPPAAIIAFDSRLTAGVVRYLHDVHEGRVDPRTLGLRLSAPLDQHDYAAIVRGAVADHRLAATAAEFAPPLALYRNLRRALARYRLLTAEATLETVPASVPVHPGEPYPAALVLARRLVAVGDLPAAGGEVTAAPLMYAGPLVDGVRRFQRRHGLDADGVIGRETQAALNVPLEWRVRQIELALERLRWLPHLENERFVAVNIPMYRLWAWDEVRPDGAASFEAGVIVGRAFDTRTPVFVEEMQAIVFRPYWNVPPSILQREILPALARQPDYLIRHNMEIVSAPGAALRVRQRPGAANSLGLVKFVFPNDENVYMHGTPVPALFARARRDFSHGCVRVDDPVGLAQWALADQPEWTRERIVAAMNGDASRQVELSRPIHVILFYMTAVVTPEDGAIHFAADIYGHDARLDLKLRQTPPPTLPEDRP